MNVNKLKGKVVENGLNDKKMSEKLGFFTSTWHRKLKNSGFTITEAAKIKEILSLSDEDAVDIFLR